MDRVNAAGGLKAGLIAATLALALAGCQTSGLSSFMAAPLIPDDDTTATAVAGYGRVFGRIVVVEEGKEQTWSKTPGFATFQVFFRSVGTDQMQRVPVTDDGSFYWPLKPGDYVIAAFSYSGSTGRLWTTFTVPAAGQAAYIGDLSIVIEKSRYGVAVQDEYAKALQRVEARLSEAKLQPVKSLMRPEGGLGSYRRILGVCAQAWGIECNRTYQGVVPVLPEGTVEYFPRIPTTASLTPLFEWKPSKADGITYDIAIYESLSLGLVIVETAKAPRQRGKLIAYAEGLREPKFQPATPLLPARGYLWSVRLRRGDTVSTWSVSSYFEFLIVGWSSGSGQWFAFSTPDK